MPRLELEFSPNEDRSFQPSIEYEDPSRTHVTIARVTTGLLDHFSEGRIEPWGINILKKDTLSLVRAAEKGFLGNIQMVRDIERIDSEHLNTLLGMNKKYSEEPTPDEDTEAFLRFYLAFGMMPELAQHAFLPKGFSRRGNLEPPFTTEEIHGRIREVGSTINQIANRGISAPEDIMGELPLLRTYWTFWTIGNTRIRTTETDSHAGINQGVLEDLANKFSDPGKR